MKRSLLSLLLILALILSLSACKKEEGDASSEKTFEISFNTSALPPATKTPDSQFVKEGSRVKEPRVDTMPTAGYAIIWTRDSSGEIPYDFTEAVTESFTLYAKEVLRTYSITYLLSGGTNVKENPASYSASSETIYLQSLPEDNCPDGYTFRCWCLFNDPSSQVEKIERGSEGDIVLRAVYSPNEYRIYYRELKTGGENPNAGERESFLYGGEDVLLEDASAEGFLFKGWCYDLTSGALLPENTITTAVVHHYFYETNLWKKYGAGEGSGMILLYARWEAVS